MVVRTRRLVGKMKGQTSPMSNKSNSTSFTASSTSDTIWTDAFFAPSSYRGQLKVEWKSYQRVAR